MHTSKDEELLATKTPDYVREHFERYPSNHLGLRPRAYLSDGTRLSIQASKIHHSYPKTNDALAYTHVEVMLGGSEIPDDWRAYRKLDTNYNLYTYIPSHLVNVFIEKHGGISYA